MPQNVKYDIGVLGAGLVGKITALSLAQKGFSVLVFAPPLFSSHRDIHTDFGAPTKKTKHQKTQDRSLVLSPFVAAYLQGLGVGLRSMSKIKFIKLNHSNTASLSLLGDEDGLGYMVRLCDLDKALDEAISGKTNISFDATKIKSQDKKPNGINITTQKGVKHCALFIATIKDDICCDLFNLRYIIYAYQAKALSFGLCHNVPHQQTAYQCFHKKHILATLPTDDPYQSHIVWSLPKTQADDFSRLKKQEQLACLNHFLPDFLGGTKTIDEIEVAPLSLSLSQKNIAPHFVLLGEGAHKIHPLAGQGLNISVRDVVALVDVLETIRGLGGHLGDKIYLEQYEAKRRFEVGLFATLTHIFATKNTKPIFSLAQYIPQKMLAPILAFAKKQANKGAHG